LPTMPEAATCVVTPGNVAFVQIREAEMRTAIVAMSIIFLLYLELYTTHLGITEFLPEGYGKKFVGVLLMVGIILSIAQDLNELWGRK